jgi:large subunit ribosomal protein L25
VEQQMFTLPIRALPGAIPTVLEVDITELTIGGQVRVSDISLPEGVTTEVDAETAIAIGQPPRVVTAEEEGAEGEAEEGAAAEGAEPTGEAAETTGGEG